VDGVGDGKEELFGSRSDQSAFCSVEIELLMAHFEL
jgi:hypothetical protein